MEECDVFGHRGRMSWDIVDGPGFGRGRSSLLGLVVGVWVEGEVLEEFSVGGDDSDFEVADQHADRCACVAAAQSDVVERSVVAQGDFAVLVDDVVSQVEVVGQDGVAGTGLRAWCVGGGWAAADHAVGPLLVIDVAERIKLGLQRGQGADARLLGQPALEGLVEALDLSAGLRVVGP